MKSVLAFGVIAIAASSLSSHHHVVRAALPALYKRAGSIVAALPCVKDLATGIPFNDKCKELFASGDIPAVTSLTLAALDLDFIKDPDPLRVTLSVPKMTVDVIAFPGINLDITDCREN
ncbi:hypothetical protein BGZ95_002516, partial [Linnemannia exigua]